MGVNLNIDDTDGTATTEIAGTDIPDSSEVETVKVPAKFQTDKTTMARMKFAAGMTVPTVPYANVRFDVGLEIPYEKGQEAEAFAFAYSWVDEKLQTIHAKLVGGE